jgi:hypothetical protein
MDIPLQHLQQIGQGLSGRRTSMNYNMMTEILNKEPLCSTTTQIPNERKIVILQRPNSTFTFAVRLGPCGKTGVKRPLCLSPSLKEKSRNIYTTTSSSSSFLHPPPSPSPKMSLTETPPLPPCRPQHHRTSPIVSD